MVSTLGNRSETSGLGGVTFDYFCMLLGVPGIKADRWIIRFVEQSLGREVSAKESHALLRRVAGQLADADDQAYPITAIELDHAVWNAMRRTVT